MTSRLLTILVGVLVLGVGLVTSVPAAFPNASIEDAPPALEAEEIIPEILKLDDIALNEVKRALKIRDKVARVSDPEASQHHEQPNDIVDDFFVPTGTFDTIETDIPGEPLSPADFDTALTIAHDAIDISQSADPIELAGEFQGDILLLSSDQVMSRDDLPPINQRNSVVDKRRWWENAVVPYVISSSFTKSERAVIASAIMRYHENTCIRFVPRTVEVDYIHILKGDGCSSNVGHVGGAQPVSLGPGCIYVGIIIHELMHAAGFWHEQSRADRDHHITIQWTNIQAGMEYNFKKYDKSEISNLGVAYDTGSIMHYGPYAFAKNRNYPTIIPNHNSVEIGQRRGFSEKDKKKLNILYGCSKPQVVTTTVKPPSPKPDECGDNDISCKYWSDIGECKKNPTWMRKHCKKSCGECGKPCSDFNQHCGTWAKRGECTKNAIYMTLFCPNSCGACAASGSGGGGSCSDNNKHCAAWTKTGQCYINADYMHVNCRKACGLC